MFHSAVISICYVKLIIVRLYLHWSQQAVRLKVTLWSEGRGRCHQCLTRSKEQLPFHHMRGQSFTTSQSLQAYRTVQATLSSHLIIIILQNQEVRFCRVSVLLTPIINVMVTFYLNNLHNQTSGFDLFTHLYIIQVTTKNIHAIINQ